MVDLVEWVSQYWKIQSCISLLPIIVSILQDKCRKYDHILQFDMISDIYVHFYQYMSLYMFVNNMHIIVIKYILYYIVDSMASKPITIHQYYQPAKQAHTRTLQAQEFPSRHNASSHPSDNQLLKSLSTVLQQALSTKDHSAIRDLLYTADDQSIRVTVMEIGTGRLVALFQAIQVILLQENKNMDNVCVISKWLKQLLKKYMGHVVNSQQLQQVCSRISKTISKRTQSLPALMTLSHSIPSINSQQQQIQSVVYSARFHYIQQQNQMQHRNQQSEAEEQQHNRKKNMKKMKKNNKHNNIDQEQSDLSNIGADDIQNLDQMLMEDDIDLDM